ncbi:hypothetical protein ACFTXJ_14130 [Streptomyces zhihengii]|uniref:hypothetical protein n=1 Tax=Streptomyces zhihengii TaxID=1818004 RepID=UPI00362DB2B2
MVDDSRARLIAYLCQAGLSAVRANAVLDDYTHGLAERQRALADANDELDHDHHVYGFSPAVRQAADSIDPKVTT